MTGRVPPHVVAWFRIVCETFEEDGIPAAQIEQSMVGLQADYADFLVELAAGGTVDSTDLWRTDIKLNAKYRRQCDQEARRFLRFQREFAELTALGEACVRGV